MEQSWIIYGLYGLACVQLGWLFVQKNGSLLVLLTGFVIWTMVWVCIAFVHNLFVSAEHAWAYFSFWGEAFSGGLWSGDLTVGNQIHINVALLFANLIALGNGDVSEQSDVTENLEE